MQKTKMIFTIGPVSDNEETLKRLMKVGMNVARFNFSHGDHEEHKKKIELVKSLREKYNKPIAIMLDTKGPEIRTGNFKKGRVKLNVGSKFTIVCGEDIQGDENQCSVSFDKLYKDVKPGNLILIDDGLVAMEVQSIEDNKIHCIIKNSGYIGSHKGINIPGVKIKFPSLTSKDVDDLIFGIKVGVDLVAASFVRRASDVLVIRKVLEENGGSEIPIISKIENHEGVKNIDEIIKFSDGIMIARGDMGVEIPIEQVPIVQKMIIEKCNNAGTPVITATQMLDSMIRNPRPTRAEASDIANAIFDGTDAIMLSGETANGKYPIDAARTMSSIAKEVEKRLNYESLFDKKRKYHLQNVPNAVSLATVATAMELKASAIIIATQSGNTAMRVSKYRPKCPIIAVTPYPNVARKLSLNWGVYSLVSFNIKTTDELIEKSVQLSLEAGYVKNGDLVIIAAGNPVYSSGTTNMMKAHVVGDILVEGKGIGTSPVCGTANVIRDYKKAEDQVQDGDILVVKNLDKNFIPLLEKASAVISQQGGITSHMAIECISREIPIIVNAENATKIIKTGTFITVDVVRGVVYSGRANVI